MSLSDIQDGIIREELVYLSNIDTKYKKYIIKSGDIIISKNGYPFKVAVSDSSEEILPSGNLFVITLNTKKVNPYYLKILLQSDYGQELFSSIMVGSTIKTISVSALENLMLPLPGIYEQNLVANEYLDIESDIKKLNLQLKNEKSKIKKLIKIKK